MLIGDIQSTLLVLIKLGVELKARLDALNQAAEDLQLLTTNLRLLLTVFENPANESILKEHVSEFVAILDILQSIAKSCAKSGKLLDMDPSGQAAVDGGRDAFGKKLIRRIWIVKRIPGLLAEIQRKAEQLQKIYSAVSVVILQDIRANQERPPKGTESSVNSTLVAQDYNQANGLDFSTNFASIDIILGNLMNECKSLRQQLEDNIIHPDTSAIENYETTNPEGMAFWKNKFQKELSTSSFRYEMLYVSWARFVREIESSFILNNIPTGIWETPSIDIVRELGHRYHIDQCGTRRLSTIRPLWLPALQSILDPLYKGYVKPQDYFSLLQNSSLSETLRKLVLENAGLGVIVECERESGDIALPASIESSLDHVGWISAQIVAVPTPKELGIMTEDDVIKASSASLISCFNDTARDIYIHVRYLQTGQVEQKSLLKKTRPAGGICIGAPISIRCELEPGKYGWSSDTHIAEFKACFGGGYNITAGAGSNTYAFSTTPIKASFDGMLQSGVHSDTPTPQLEFILLGPSKVFYQAPKIGEKIQVEYDGIWHDSRVTLVVGDEIEFVDWDEIASQAEPDNPIEDGSSDSSDDYGGCFFSEDMLENLGKGTRRLWRPWKRDITKYDVRPFRCLHIGDSIDAPVMYPDFRFHYHTAENSQLYLPARIVDVKGDQYVVEFSPAVSAYAWWPGRLEKDTAIELIPGSGVYADNPYEVNRATLAMNLVRPLSTGPRPVLGMQSGKPPSWSSFQGVQLGNLEELLEESLWNDGGR
ncbi:hypothetical protein BB8028_0005g01520 [Beauveria bassiana]|uniref:Uncharacterized protein n=1 Tax=Beauveria bassiana TaxID=176275 RepID=A0A2S7YEK5_BEABA|nr:hypothetical protein BB8028_0005g01520 [Beauveria bassiana]